MEIKFSTKFDIGDSVYHVTPDSPQGVIIDISYSVSKKHYQYNVSFGHEANDTVWCEEVELSESKVF